MSLCALLVLLAAVPASPQAMPDIGFTSVGRPLATDVRSVELVGAVEVGGRGAAARFIGSARDGAVPPGIQPLPIDIFTTRDFYADRALWTDKRYFRCNAPTNIEDLFRRSCRCSRPNISSARCRRRFTKA